MARGRQPSSRPGRGPSSSCAARGRLRRHPPEWRRRFGPEDADFPPPGPGPGRPGGDLPPPDPRGLRVRRGGRAHGIPRRRSASRTSTSRRSSKPRRGRRTATTCSTTPGSARRREVARRSSGSSRRAGRPASASSSTWCPNHMAVPRPAHLNAPFWSLLRDGLRSSYAGWFDVDWVAEDDRILMPVLGGTLEQAVESGELVVADDGGPGGSEHVLRYYDAEFPVAPGTEDLPLPELLDAQAYRLSAGGRPVRPSTTGASSTSRRSSRCGSRTRGLHGDARPPALAARPRRGGRLPDRPPRRARRPAGLPRPARRRDRRGLGRRREDPRGRGGPARVVALRRDDGIRRASAGAAGAHPLSGPRGPGPAVGRRGARPCEPGRRHHGRQAARRRRRPGGRGGPAHAARASGARRHRQRRGPPRLSRRSSWPWTATAPTSPAAESTPSSRRSSSRRRSGPQRLLAPSDLDALGLVVDLVLGRDLPQAQLDTRAAGRRLPACGSSRPADR